MTDPLSLAAVVAVCLTTLLVGGFGLRISRATSDFYVAGRAVTPRMNASAIGGEYLSAASFLGVAGLVYDRGVDMLWLPVGYTVGYLVLLVTVAAPMRRSGAYTLPDFAEARLESRALRLMSSVLVVAIGWLYLVPQLQGANLALSIVTGAPSWVGGLLVTLVVGVAVGAGGMKSITVVQAVQYWIKLTALAVPAFVLLALWTRSGAPRPHVADPSWSIPLQPLGSGDHPLYRTYSTVLALVLGTMGLPHVVVRYYTNPDGVAARRTTVAVIGLLGLFYLLPPVYGVLGRLHLPTLPEGVRSDSIVLRLPGLVVEGLPGELLTAMLAGGAFAAFLSTASGLAMSVTGVLDQDLLRPGLARLTGGDASNVAGFRAAAVIAVLVPYGLSRLTQPIGIATTVGLAFEMAAATFAPMLLLGVWWRRLSTVGAAAGLLAGGAAAAIAVGVTVVSDQLPGWPGALLTNPAAWATPLALVVAVGVSLATPGRVPPHTATIMVRLHTPERVALARSRLRD